MKRGASVQQGNSGIEGEGAVVTIGELYGLKFAGVGVRLGVIEADGYLVDGLVDEVVGLGGGLDEPVESEFEG
jgi:hypothetical protein